MRCLRLAVLVCLAGLAASSLSMAGELGLDVDLDAGTDLAALSSEAALFSESNGRFVVTVGAGDVGSFEALFAGLACVGAGFVTAAPRLRLVHHGRVVVDADVLELKRAWKETLAHA